MKKAIIITIVLASFLIVGIVLARENQPGNPFDQIWEAIMEIKAEILVLWENVNDHEERIVTLEETTPTYEGKRILSYSMDRFWKEKFHLAPNDSWQPTPLQTSVTCPVDCVIQLDATLDTELTTSNPAGIHYQFYVDGEYTIGTSTHNHVHPYRTISVPVIDLWPVPAGTHTIEVHAYPWSGEWDIIKGTLRAVAFEQ